MKNKNISECIIFSIFTFVGLLFLGIGILYHHIYIGRTKNWILTKAEIIEIENNSFLDEKHSVKIEFFVKNKAYQTELNEWNSNMKVTDRIEILYNPENPYHTITAEYPFLCFIFCLLGGLFTLIGTIPFIHIYGKNKLKKKLKENGDKIEATIDSVKFNMLYSVNGKHPYIVNCSYINPTDKKNYIFKSENIWFDINQIIEEKNISKIIVYINKKNKRQYYVDIETLTKN